MAAEAMKRRSDECPALETLAAYLDDRLSDGERGRVAAHVAECETCYFVFSEAVQMRRTHAIAETPVSADRLVAGRWATKRTIWSAGGLLAAAASLVLAFQLGWFVDKRSADSPELRALVAAVATERPIEPRVTGGFAHGPFRGSVRAGDPSNNNISPDIRIAAAQIEKAFAGQRTPQALRALGISHLVTGNVGRAVPLLEQSADQPNPDANTLNDLGAAYLVRASRENQPQDVAKALATIDRAVAIDPGLPEAVFNRAYALEKLSLRDEARRAWEAYLRIEQSSEWAAEARRHLRELGPDGP